jgi:hypothetical protein
MSPWVEETPLDSISSEQAVSDNTWDARKDRPAFQTNAFQHNAFQTVLDPITWAEETPFTETFEEEPGI